MNTNNFAQNHANSLTIEEAQHMLDTMPISAEGSPLHNALIERTAYSHVCNELLTFGTPQGTVQCLNCDTEYARKGFPVRCTTTLDA